MLIGHAVLAAGAGALALGAVHASQPVEVPPKSIRTASAACKPGRTALSAGFQTRQSKDSGVARIGMRKAKNHVSVRAYNFGEDPGGLVAYVYCRASRVPPAARVVRTTVKPERAASLVAVCPRGTRVISGGFATGGFNQPTGPQVLALTSKRVGSRRWKVAGFNLPEDDPASNSQGRPGKLAAYAYCLRGDAGLTAVSRRVKVPPMPSQGIDRPRTFRVSCPAGRRAVSGGFDGHLRLGDKPRAAGALTSMRTRDGRGWRTSAVSLSDTASSTITAFVYCAARGQAVAAH